MTARISAAQYRALKPTANQLAISKGMKIHWKKRRQKYNAQPTTVDGLKFDSKAEARHYATLKVLQRNSQIKNLQIHPRYPLHVNGVKIGDLVLDFAFIDAHGTPCFQDVKGVMTRHAKWKISHFEAQYSAKVEIIRKGRSA